MEIILFTLSVFAVAIFTSFILKRIILSPRAISKTARCNPPSITRRMGIILALLAVLIASESFKSMPEKEIEKGYVVPLDSIMIITLIHPKDPVIPPKPQPLTEPPPIPEKMVVKPVNEEVKTENIHTPEEQDKTPAPSMDKAPVLKEAVDATPGIEIKSPPEPKEPAVFEPYQVKKMATYPGGLNKLRREIARKYNSRKIKEEGKVVLRFVVLENGEIGDISILKGIENCASCSEEAIRVLKNLKKKFEPAELANGSKVKVSFVLPLELRKANE